MAQVVFRAPDTDFLLPNTRDTTAERGVTFKAFVDRCNTMFNELYTIVGGSPTQHVTLRGPNNDTYLPNTGDFSAERGDSFKTIVDQISAMFNEVYTISGGATTAKVTLRGPKLNVYLPNTRDFTVERGDSFKTIVTQCNAMFAECYANGGGFTPASLANLALWIDPSDTATMFQSNAGSTTVTDGSVCGYAGDKSGNAFHLTSIANDGTRPTWNNNGGLPYLNFDGSDDILRKVTSLGLYANGSASIFIAVRGITPSAGASLAAEGNSGNDTPIVAMLRADATNTSNSPFYRNDANTVILNATPATANAYDSTDNVFGATDDGATYTPYLDGMAGTPASYTRSGAITIDQFALGALLRLGVAGNFAGRVYQCVAVKGVPTGPEIANLITYLGFKMGRVL